MQKIATFCLGETLLGVDILLVKEIYRHMSLTPIPSASPHFKGLMNLRGRVVTVIDLNVCLDREPTPDINNCRLLIFKTNDEIAHVKHEGYIRSIDLGEDIVGFLIDKMDDVINVEEDKILPPPPNLDSVDRELIRGVVKRGGNLVILLDVNAILNLIMNLG
ncbi:MAG: purine-binding chemotaxis protein CheW [Desulfobacterales bacterium]|nr:purine-binding chemotaxis protein CheW [Desulfobacterales bacterium]